MLAELVRRAERGEANAVLFIGDPGIGKSRLLQDGLPQNETIIRMRGAEPERNVPFAAARAIAEAEPSADVATRLSALARRTDDVEQLQVFESVYRSLSAIDPLILVLDDLQWVDDASIALVHYLLRGAKAAGQGFALAVASRPSSAAALMRASLEKVVDDPSGVFRELQPLDRDEGIALAGALVSGLPKHEAEEMWRIARGSPFWLTTLTTARGAADPMDAVRSRLRGIGADAAALLSLVTVAGRALHIDETAELLEWPSARASSASSELIDLGLVVLDTGLIRTAHDLIREVVSADIPSMTRQRLHVRLARWLAHQAANDPLTLLEALEHELAAGLDGLDLAYRAVTSSHRRFLGAEGLRAAARAVDRASPDEPRTLELQEALARLCSELNQVEDAYRRWSIVLETAPDPDRRTRAALEASKAALLLGREETAAQLFRRIQPTGDAATSISVTSHHSRILWSQKDHDAARRTAGQAADGARELVRRRGGPVDLTPDERQACVEAFTALVDSAMVYEDTATMVTVADEIATLARGADAQVHLRALLMRTRAVMLLDVERSIEYARRAWDEARERILPAIALDAGYLLAHGLRHRGALTEAEDVAGRAAALAVQVGEFVSMRYPIPEVRRLIGLSRGPWQPALEALERYATRTTHAHYRIGLRREIALWKARLTPRATDDVLRQIDLGMDDALAVGCERCLAELRLRAAEATARVGRIEDAQRWLREWEASRPTPDAYWTAVQQVVHGLVRASSDPAAASERLEAAARSLDALSLGFDGIWARLTLASTLARADQSRAAAAARQAGERAERSGARTEATIAEQMLRTLGVRTWRRQAVAPGADELAVLTAREREIARLAAGGADNPSIASSLFLSRKTVERHLSNVFAKLGVKNRVELAGRLAADRATYDA